MSRSDLWYQWVDSYQLIGLCVTLLLILLSTIPCPTTVCYLFIFLQSYYIVVLIELDIYSICFILYCALLLCCYQICSVTFVAVVVSIKIILLRIRIVLYLKNYIYKILLRYIIILLVRSNWLIICFRQSI